MPRDEYHLFIWFLQCSNHILWIFAFSKYKKIKANDRKMNKKKNYQPKLKKGNGCIYYKIIIVQAVSILLKEMYYMKLWNRKCGL